MNTICVGSTDENLNYSATSSWKNEGDYGVAMDREEPDIIAQGVESDALHIDANDYSATSPATGTSFASPLAAGMGVLLQEACGNTLNHLQVRAVFRNAGWTQNADGSVYSTPTPLASDPTYGSYHKDWKDGGGYAFANALLGFCGGDPGPKNTTELLQIDLTKGDPPPEGQVPIPQSVTGHLTTEQFGPINNSTMSSYNLGQFTLAAAERIRATISWDTCVTSQEGYGPSVNGVDYDLVLYNETTQAYATGSQSMQDVNEGWDFTPASAGTYDVLLVWPTGITGCDGDIENVGVAITWW